MKSYRLTANGKTLHTVKATSLENATHEVLDWLRSDDSTQLTDGYIGHTYRTKANGYDFDHTTVSWGIESGMKQGIIQEVHLTTYTLKRSTSGKVLTTLEAAGIQEARNLVTEWVRETYGLGYVGTALQHDAQGQLTWATVDFDAILCHLEPEAMSTPALVDLASEALAKLEAAQEALEAAHAAVRAVRSAAQHATEDAKTAARGATSAMRQLDAWAISEAKLSLQDGLRGGFRD